jgi:hypothetical protein
MRLHNLAVAASVFVVLGAAVQGEAAVFATSPGSKPLRDGFTGFAPYAGTLGWNFAVGPTTLYVTDVGYFDGPNSLDGANGDGLLSSHEVGLFDGATLLGSAVVPAGGGTLLGDFRYVHLATPITLSASTTYQLGGQVTVADFNGTGDVFMDGNGGATFAPEISAVNGVPSFSGPPSNPSFNDGVFRPLDSAGQGYFGGNFIFQTTAPIPEPASLGLLALGAASRLPRRRA